MLSSPDSEVCVIIAAMNAADTLSRAVASCLRERRVSEVIVADDASSDATADAARGADDGTGRLRILRFETNRGPAAARNHAIEQSRAPLIAILDADDFFLNGRFDTLVDGEDWDFIADNILFVSSDIEPGLEPRVPRFAAEPSFLDLCHFIEGNISRRGARRGEIGFLKPVMRRRFLEEKGLRYREDLRLGEDFELYVRALAHGARFKIVRTCGYGAMVRHNSLSGRHRTEDLRRLGEADRAILTNVPLAPAARKALQAHERHIRSRYELRHFLDMKSRKGLVSAGLSTLSRPSTLPAVAGGVAADKYDAFFRRSSPSVGADTTSDGLRTLLPGRISA